MSFDKIDNRIMNVFDTSAGLLPLEIKIINSIFLLYRIVLQIWVNTIINKNFYK